MMPAIKFSAALVQSSSRCEADLSEDVTIGGIARYLGQHETSVSTNTLELARPLLPSQRLQDVNFRPGDRLVIFTQPPEPVEFPAALHRGDRSLKFSLGDFEVSSRGRKILLVGKPDEARGVQPDIDLRDFVPAQSLPFISRECLRLFFDEDEKWWFAQKVGQTRLVIDEFELGDSEIVLDGEKWLYFYRASDDPKLPASRPIGGLRLQVEESSSGSSESDVHAGSHRLGIWLGSEQDSQTLNASENLVMERIVIGLVHYTQIVLKGEYRLCLMRLLSPEVRVGALRLAPDEFLYVPRSVSRR
jgi:hypothetical protein